MADMKNLNKPSLEFQDRPIRTTNRIVIIRLLKRDTPDVPFLRFLSFFLDAPGAGFPGVLELNAEIP